MDGDKEVHRLLAIRRQQVGEHVHAGTPSVCLDALQQLLRAFRARDVATWSLPDRPVCSPKRPWRFFGPTRGHRAHAIPEHRPGALLPSSLAVMSPPRATRSSRHKSISAL